MIFTLFLPKPPAEAIKTLRVLFNVILGYLAYVNVTADMSEQPTEDENGGDV